MCNHHCDSNEVETIEIVLAIIYPFGYIKEYDQTSYLCTYVLSPEVSVIMRNLTTVVTTTFFLHATFFCRKITFLFFIFNVFIM